MSSPGSQLPLPHCAQGPQSAWQVVHVSPASQLLLPQHEPQSAGQVEQVSPPLQTSSPQPMPPVVDAPVVELVVEDVDVVVVGPLPLVALFVVPDPLPVPPAPPTPSPSLSPSVSMPLPFAHAAATKINPAATIGRKQLKDIRTSALEAGGDAKRTDLRPAPAPGDYTRVRQAAGNPPTPRSELDVGAE
jgi:hypothetical protein